MCHVARRHFSTLSFYELTCFWRANVRSSDCSYSEQTALKVWSRLVQIKFRSIRQKQTGTACLSSYQWSCESWQYYLCVRGCVGVPELDIIRFLLFVHILAVHDRCWRWTQKHRLCDLNKSRCMQIADAWSQRYEHAAISQSACFCVDNTIMQLVDCDDKWKNEWMIKWTLTRTRTVACPHVNQRSCCGKCISTISREQECYFSVIVSVILLLYGSVNITE